MQHGIWYRCDGWFTAHTTRHGNIRYTGELSSDMLMKLRPEAKRFTIEECQRLAKEWDELKRNQSILRVWQNGIVHVEESEFDVNIINSAKYLQASNKEQWLSPVNVIGQMVNITDDYINETFIENRLLYLAQQGLFEISGDTTDINAYKINYIGQ